MQSQHSLNTLQLRPFLKNCCSDHNLLNDFTQGRLHTPCSVHELQHLQRISGNEVPATSTQRLFTPRVGSPEVEAHVWHRMVDQGVFGEGQGVIWGSVKYWWQSLPVCCRRWHTFHPTLLDPRGLPGSKTIGQAKPWVPHPNSHFTVSETFAKLQIVNADYASFRSAFLKIDGISN